MTFNANLFNKTLRMSSLVPVEIQVHEIDPDFCSSKCNFYTYINFLDSNTQGYAHCLLFRTTELDGTMERGIPSTAYFECTKRCKQCMEQFSRLTDVEPDTTGVQQARSNSGAG